MIILKLRENKDIADKAANWFHSKWGIPMEEYKKSIDECIKCAASVPQWYVAMQNTEIVGGIGVIENDFHLRKDLSPNICALYVEEKHRGNKIAKKLLQYACEDMAQFGINTMYLVTDHTEFYERCGWEFLCMVTESEEPYLLTRMYVHNEKIRENA